MLFVHSYRVCRAAPGFLSAFIEDWTVRCTVLFQGIKVVVWWRSTVAMFAGRLWSFVTTALQWSESELPDRPKASLWRSLVLPLYMSPPVGQRGAMLGATKRRSAWSDTHLPPLPSGTAPWHTALAWGWYKHIQIQFPPNIPKLMPAQ